MVTKHINRLEHYLKLKLLQRSTRHLQLTPRGAEYLIFCQKILLDIQETEQNLHRDQYEIEGLLRINIPSVLGIHYLLPKLQAFQHQYPNIEFEIDVSDDRTDLIKEKFDLVFRFGMPVEPYLIARPMLEHVDMVVAASPQYWQQHGTPRTLAELTQHNYLGCSQSNIAGNQTWIFDQEQQISIAGNTLSNSGLMLIEYALAHLGVVYQPRAAIGKYLASGHLVEAHLDIAGYQERSLVMLYAKNEYMSKKLITLIDFLSAD